MRIKHCQFEQNLLKAVCLHYMLAEVIHSDVFVFRYMKLNESCDAGIPKLFN